MIQIKCFQHFVYISLFIFQSSDMYLVTLEQWKGLRPPISKCPRIVMDPMTPRFYSHIIVMKQQNLELLWCMSLVLLLFYKSCQNITVVKRLQLWLINLNMWILISKHVLLYFTNWFSCLPVQGNPIMEMHVLYHHYKSLLFQLSQLILLMSYQGMFV